MRRPGALGFVKQENAMLKSQEPKYDATPDGKIFNRASGQVVWHVFGLTAKDLI